MYVLTCIPPSAVFLLMWYDPPWRGRGLPSRLFNWLNEQNILEAWWHGFWDWLYSFYWVSVLCLPWEPSHHTVRKLSLAHVERPLKQAHVERNWGPQWIASSNGQTHKGESLQKILGLAFELLSQGPDIYPSWKGQAIPTVPCPNSCPREFMT